MCFGRGNMIPEPSACLLTLPGVCSLGYSVLGTLASQGTPYRKVTLEVGVRDDPLLLAPGLEHSSIVTLTEKSWEDQETRRHAPLTVREEGCFLDPE